MTDRGAGWYTVWIKRTPIPLIAMITIDRPDEHVAWDFRGFWAGDGAVHFEPTDDGTRITGHETIALPRPLRFMERFLESGFAAVWEGGWRHLRKRGVDAK